MASNIDLWLHALGPDRGVVLREVDALLHCGYVKISQRLREGPICIATGESRHLQGLMRRLTEVGATITWTNHAPPAEWVAAIDPQQMLEALSALRVSPERKWRLCAVAFCSRLRPSWLDFHVLAALELAEQVADGRATKDQLTAALRYLGPDDESALHQALRLDTGFEWVEEIAGAGTLSAETERAIQVELLRDIFGNPFRPVRFSPDWRTDTAVALAQQMYDSRDFSAMPTLADALQEAGCDSASVLEHCRAPGNLLGAPPPFPNFRESLTKNPSRHVRGCWVVDLVLGKG
jgi:hypothetical protein